MGARLTRGEHHERLRSAWGQGSPEASTTEGSKTRSRISEEINPSRVNCHGLGSHSLWVKNLSLLPTLPHESCPLPRAFLPLHEITPSSFRQLPIRILHPTSFLTPLLFTTRGNPCPNPRHLGPPAVLCHLPPPRFPLSVGPSPSLSSPLLSVALSDLTSNKKRKETQ